MAKPICMETCSCLELCDAGETEAERRKYDGWDGWTDRDLDDMADALAARDWASRGGVA